jgi:hypothetical protein
MSLARLWQRQGRRDEACAALAAVYGTFTEGFTTPDLVDAAAQLNSREERGLTDKKTPSLPLATAILSNLLSTHSAQERCGTRAKAYSQNQGADDDNDKLSRSAGE